MSWFFRNCRVNKFWLTLGVLAAAALGGIFLLKLPPLANAMDGPEFCGICHVMEPQVDSYLHSAHRDAARCGDCHLPHGLVRGSFYKAYTGTRDAAAVLLKTYPATISISAHGKEVVQENCLRCHGDMAAVIGDTKRDGGLYCYECHRQTPHLK